MICFPNAKINLGLHVMNKRPDGFHNIESVFYPFPLHDMLEVIALKGAGKWEFEQYGIPVGGDPHQNLIVKAYELLAADFQLPSVRICLYKKIPMGAGLGGGSSDAAFMLKLLNEKFALALTVEQLKTYASELGSDCPFFVDNKPAYLYGKGHELEPYDISLKGWHAVLLYPQEHSNTAIAYRNVTKRETFSPEFSLKNNLAVPVEAWKETIVNDFEPSVFAAFPGLPELKQGLYKAGAAFVLMSGSGSSVFALFAQRPVLPGSLKKFVVYEGVLD